MYRKKYDIKKITESLKEFAVKKDKNSMSLEELLETTGYDLLDVNEFYIKNVKHVMRYDK